MVITLWSAAVSFATKGSSILAKDKACFESYHKNVSSIETVGIIGGGAIGRALAGVFVKENKSVLIWDVVSEKRTVLSVKELIRDSDLIILAIPAKANRAVAKEISNNASSDKNRLILSVAKGVEKGFRTMDEVLGQESLGNFDYGLLYGPMLAHEIVAGKSAFAIAALSNSFWIDSLKLSPKCKFKP
jgi:glycerol-3-phosphate dehydrogenase